MLPEPCRECVATRFHCDVVSHENEVPKSAFWFVPEGTSLIGTGFQDPTRLITCVEQQKIIRKSVNWQLQITPSPILSCRAIIIMCLFHCTVVNAAAVVICGFSCADKTSPVTPPGVIWLQQSSRYNYCSNWGQDYQLWRPTVKPLWRCSGGVADCTSSAWMLEPGRIPCLFHSVTETSTSECLCINHQQTTWELQRQTHTLYLCCCCIKASLCSPPLSSHRLCLTPHREHNTKWKREKKTKGKALTVRGMM